MEQFNEKGEVICQICGKSSEVITATHLKTHSISMVEYKEKFPGVQISGEKFKARKRHVKDKNIFFKEPEVEIAPEFSLDKIPTDIITDQPDFYKDLKKFVEVNKVSEYPNPKNLINKGKLKILNYLLSVFYDVRDSYYVTKFNITGFLEYKLITDISIPSKKIDFEFPDTFWHNSDVPKHNRDQKLRQDGWKIIDIPGNNPSIEDIKNILNKK